MAPACAAGRKPAQETEPATTSTGTGGATGGGGGAVGGSGGLGGQGGTGGEAPTCEEDPCKLVLPQCGCPVGERCHLKTGKRTCVAEGMVELGYKCANNCTAGHLCYNNLTGGSGVCHKYCNSDQDCAAPGGICFHQVSGGAASLCTQNCDPVTDTGCFEKPEMKCELNAFGDPPNWFTYCTGVGSKNAGDTCVSSNQCKPGHGCVGVNMVSICAQWCSMPPNGNCEVGYTCVGFMNPATVGSIEYGACVKPN